MQAHMHTRTHIHTNKYIQTNTHTTHTYTKHSHIQTHIYTHTQTHTHTYIYKAIYHVNATIYYNYVIFPLLLACYATAIKLRPKDPQPHVSLAAILEELFYLEDLYGFKKEVRNSCTYIYHV